MILIYFSASNIGDIFKLYGIMTVEKYSQVLNHCTMPCEKYLIANRFFFFRRIYDNDPKHIVSIVKVYLNRKTQHGTLSVVVWPPQSRDLNVIEAMWDHFDRVKAADKEEL